MYATTYAPPLQTFSFPRLKGLCVIRSLLLSVFALLALAAFLPGARLQAQELDLGDVLLDTPLGDAPVTTDSSYVLGANDVINISVYGEDDLSLRDVRIADSGIITFPLLGEVRAAGNTIRGFELALREGLIREEYLVDPRITITMVEYRPFYIDGEVEKPGSYPFQPGLTVRRAVSIAGGFTSRAARNGITIHSTEDLGASEREAGSLDAPVGPGDLVSVPQRFF